MPPPRARLAPLLVSSALAALVSPALGALGDDWPGVSAFRAATARFSGGVVRGALCAISACDDQSTLPTPPGGRYARWGPLETRLVHLDEADTAPYGFPGALVACPVFPAPNAPNAPAGGAPGAGLQGILDRALTWLSSELGSLGDGGGASESSSDPLLRPRVAPAKIPGIAWSYGGQGSCDGSRGFADAADGFSREMAGDDKGYWLPELLEHAASWGIAAACPTLPGGVPIGDGRSTVGAALMLADLQPCQYLGDVGGGPPALIDRSKLGVAGYSLGGGRAVRGAATGVGRASISAVVAVHPWNPGNGRTAAPTLVLTSTEDTNAPFRDARRAFRNADGSRLLAALDGGDHYTSPRFWAGATVAFFLTHLQGDRSARREVWGARGIAASPRMTRVERRCVESDGCE